MIRIRFKIHYQPGSIARFVAALALSILVLSLITDWSSPKASAPSLDPQSGIRQYYLTTGFYHGNEAADACAAGYHMASFWEISDPSNLRYDTSLGKTNDDSGYGPPTAFTVSIHPIPRSPEEVIYPYWGWVRTGYSKSTSNTAGHANCSGWESDSSSHWGTAVSLPHSWDAGTDDLGVWDVYTKSCDAGGRVWCVADTIEWRLYLPGVMDGAQPK